MKNREYWRRRFEAIEKTAVRKGLKYNERLEKEYYKAMRSIESNIATWYQRFANNNEIDMAEAKRLLNTKELKEFRWTVEDYIKNGQDNAVSQEWLKELENASSKVHITRLESLQVQLQQEIEKLYGNQVDDIDKLTKSIYEDTYYHSAFEIQKGFNVGWNLQRFNEKQLQHVIETPWTLDDKTFSDRIWLRKEELLNMARTELSQTIIRGDAPDKAIKNIAKKLEVDKHKAGRLVMTESAYFASSAQKQCFIDLDVEKYEIVATLDSRTSEICQELDGQVRDMKDYKVGDTAPPFHPWCRTTTVPYFEDNYGERVARDPYTGEVFYVPSSMKYKEWEEKYLLRYIQSDKTSDIVKDIHMKKISNNPVRKVENVLDEKQIIKKIAGRDTTKGSCSSVAFTYVGNKAGYDVLDFRGGRSREYFARLDNISKIANLPNVKSVIIEDKDDYVAIDKLLKLMEEDKEYYCAFGSHAAIIKKVGMGKYEYLELQNYLDSNSGWNTLNKTVLSRRFRCTHQSIKYGISLPQKNLIIDIESLYKSDDFIELLGYINTDEKEQKLIKYEKEMETIKKNSKNNKEDIGFLEKINNTKEEAIFFKKSLIEAKTTVNEKARWRVDDTHSIEGYIEDKLIVTEGGSTIAITPYDDIISVCRNENDTLRGKDLIDIAIKNGGNKLDSYDGNYGFYRKCGFEPVSWTKFDKSQAPSDWDEKRDDEEDIIFFKYTGNKSSLSQPELEEELRRFKQNVSSKEYEEAMKERDDAI